MMKTRNNCALPLLRFQYYRPDLWLPEVAHRCDLCGEWVAKIGVPERICVLELHAQCPRASRDMFDRAKELIGGTRPASPKD